MARRLKVLVVEDSSASFAAIRLATKRMSTWSLKQARDGASALTLCATTHPDVVTLDLGLPGGGGLELLDTVKARFDIPVIIVSASTYEGSPVSAEALARGADACFDKARILIDAPNFLRTLGEAARPNPMRRSHTAA